jgi:prepilin-type N-terminal cleavage/methylation domain-containing protein
MKRKGFSLIELLIVLVVMAILVAITIPRFARSKEKANVAALKSDLRNLATVEENYAADSNGVYFSGNGSAQGVVPSQGVVLNATATNGTTPAYSATASHAQSGRSCDLSTQGQISCT